MHRSFHSSTLFLLFVSFMFSQPIFSQSETTVEYRVTFTGNWTLASTPGGVVGSAHFTTIAGGKHNSSVSFWSSGAKATSGLEALAELGSTSGFINEINSSAYTDASFTSGVSGGGTGTSTFTLNMKKTHPLITLASMIGPSPDWFVGLHGYSLLDHTSNWVSSATVNLYPYDAGTEDGSEFRLGNPATSPQGVITSLRGVGKFSNAPMATISFTLRDSPPPPPQISPTITAIERPSSTLQATNADSVTWLVAFSEAVQNVSTDDFVVVGTTATATSVSLTNRFTNEYLVVVSGGNLANLDSTISLGLSSQQNITNNSGVRLSTTLPSTNETYRIDNTAPRVSSVVPTSVDESPFTATIFFNETIRASSFSDAEDVSSDNAKVSAPRGSGASYQVTVTPDSPSRRSTITLTIPAGAATDLAGNLSTAHGATIAYSPDIERIPPGVDNVAAIKPDGLYHTGDELEVGVTFSQEVTVTGTPTLTLQFDNHTSNALYTRGTGSNFLVFSYVLVGGDATEDLDYVNTQSLTLSGGTIVGSGGQAADLTLPSPGATGSLSRSSDIRTSGRQDAKPTFGNSSIENQVLMMNQRVDSIPLPTASGGDEPLEYALAPMLPPGLQLDEEGRFISGTPTEVFEMTAFTWSVTDVDGDTARLTFTITILPSLPLQFENSASIPDRVFLQNESITTVDLPVAKGGDGALTYSLMPDLPTGLTLDLAARQISGIPTEALRPTTFTWGVVDAEGASAELTFLMTVLEDLQPNFDASTTNTNQVFIQGSVIMPVTLPRATSGNGQLTHDLVPDLPAGLVLDRDSFEISGNATTPQTRTQFEWSATDSDGDTATFSFYITVLEDLMPSFSADTAIPEREFISDSKIEPISLPAAMGGNGALSYNLSPNLPPGLELNSASSEINGAPTTAQERTQFTWTATDVDGDSISIGFYLTVIEDAQPVFSDQVEDKVFIKGTPIESFTLPEASGGNGQLTHNLFPDLPEGLVLDKNSFEISGNATTPQMRTKFEWSATDSDGDTTTFSFYMTVLEDLMPSFSADAAIPEREFISDSEIEPFSLPSAMSGNGALSYDLAPHLPPGLELNLMTFEISGTPTTAQERTQFTWTVTDIDGDIATFSFYITVLEDLMPSFSADATVPEREFISDSEVEPISLPAAMGGNGVLSYDISPNLPPGLELNSASLEINGTPTTAHQRTQFSWIVTDIDGDTATLSFYITVLEDLMPSFSADAAIPEREFISDSDVEPISLPTAMGGNGALSYNLSPNLPPGLELNSASFEINGTPTTAQERTQFSWTVTDVDGDSISLGFYLTVIQDTQPVFSDQVEDKVFVMGTPIESFALPVASGGNGQLTYEISPQLQNGLRFGVDSTDISGTPTAESPTSTYSWTVTDVDGDTATLTFSITVNPAQPRVIGSIANVQLIVGGSAQTVDASSAVEGRVDSWRVEVSNTDVANVSSSAPGVLTLSPRIEGETTVTVHASNVTGSVALEVSVTVETARIENDQIDKALSLKAGAILSSAMSVFKHRAHSHEVANDTGAESTLQYARKMELDESHWSEPRDPNLMNYGNLSLGQRSTINTPASVGFMNDFVPLNFAHTTARWSMWGAVDFQNFSNGASENELDGTLSSLYFGTDLAVSDKVAAGIAYARHVGSSAYEFSSGDASGDAEIDTTLNAFYPYLQAGDGNRFSMFLVGGIGYGDSQIYRDHAFGSDQDSDTDLTLFAGGFDYVIMRRSNLDFAIVGDAGAATLTTQADSGVLSNRQSSSSKSTIGGSVSFNPQIEGGSMVTSVDIRLANGADGEESGSGFELGANLNYFGERIDFMLDGRTTSRSADADIQRSSISARLRYRAKTDGTGLTFALRPKWQDSALLTTSERFEPPFHAQGFLPYTVNSHRSVEGEIAYGFLSNHETSLIKPRLAWQRIDSRGTILKLGTRWNFLRTPTPGSSWGLDLVRDTSADGRDTYGFAGRIEMPF